MWLEVEDGENEEETAAVFIVEVGPRADPTYVT